MGAFPRPVIGNSRLVDLEIRRINCHNLFNMDPPGCSVLPHIE